MSKPRFDVYNNTKKEQVKAMLKTFNIIIYKAEEGGFYAECPALKGCYTQGDTINEIKENMKEAIELYLEDNPRLDYFIEDSVTLEVANA